MPNCTKIRRKHRKVCLGDLDTQIAIKTRATELKNGIPVAGFITYSQPWALWETVRGLKVFDDTDAEVNVTDRAIVAYDPALTVEFFVELDGVNYRIISAEDYDKRNEWTELLLTSRGITTKAVNDA